MSDSASCSTVNIKTEIDRLVKIEEEKTELLSYFTKHKDQQDDALSDLNLFATNEKKLNYLRTFLGSDDVSSMKRDLAHIVKEEINREVKKVRRVLEGSMSSPGYSTLSDIGDLAQRCSKISFPLELTASAKAKSPGKFLSPPNGNDDVPESQVQEYFISECQALEKFGAVNNKLIIKDTHASPSLGTRKPDFIFIQKGSTVDPFNVVVVGEIKLRVGGRFNNTHIGQAISFGEKVLQLQPMRKFVYVVLTDCIIIEIFIVYRMDSATNSEIFTRYTYDHIGSEYLAFAKEGENKGWKYLVTIMESSPNSLGWVEPSLKFSTNTVKLVKCIGMGRTSVVYEGTFNGESVAEDIKDIIKVLESAHSLSYVHRDLRKYNFIRDENGKIVIIDWGYCIKTDTDYGFSFAGALECMPDEVLSSIIRRKNIFYGPRVDLVCFVRSFYLMLHRPSMTRVPFDKNDDDISTRAQYILNFWKDCAKSDVWRNIYSAIDDLDYNRLIQELEKLF
ncbi:hypothetical protein RhiirA4_550573 [Rhizophagus irregularis]|uniref:Protein kinase domain-containing protein n=1 Tax=Rhizophagus irregularis TaxID=588596 RepID=A0A2I1HMS2_9GLOM|nr:hypothetical protein RhiirA4_550573 [Rhizophagus irregularis]